MKRIGKQMQRWRLQTRETIPYGYRRWGKKQPKLSKCGIASKRNDKWEIGDSKTLIRDEQNTLMAKRIPWKQKNATQKEQRLKNE